MHWTHDDSPEPKSDIYGALTMTAAILVVLTLYLFLAPLVNP